jgi:halimadienyl-diphosphate synthase
MDLNLKARAQELVKNLNCRLGPSAYDIAWMARLPADSGGPRWPELIDWLIEHQWLDGSWGGQIRYYHDRILCTLAAVIALRQWGDGLEVQRAIKAGVQYVWKNLQFLHHDPIELVGFELIVPTLMAEARRMGLEVPSHSGGYARIRSEKLRLVPRSAFYTPGTPTAFSLEFLGESTDPRHQNDVHLLQGPNGAVANSPAATVYYLRQVGNENQQALDYLEGVRTLSEGIPAFHPWRIFELAWVLEHLSFTGVPLKEFADDEVFDELKKALGPEGVGIDTTFGINDGDTTSVVLHALVLAKRGVDPAILEFYEEKKTRTFRTLAFERNASVGTNVHALEALTLMDDYPDRKEVWDRVVAALMAEQKYRSYWVDKWHASPFYATCHVLIALINAGDLGTRLITECIHSIDWLLHTQREDGSWGYFDRGTMEETAYALLALLHYHRKIAPVNLRVLQQAASYLYQNVTLPQVDHPSLWIAKSLYRPESFIESAILAALTLFQQTFGHIP